MADPCDEAWRAFHDACNSIQSDAKTPSEESAATAFGAFVGQMLKEMSQIRRNQAIKDIISILVDQNPSGE